MFIDVIPAGVYPNLINKMVHAATQNTTAIDANVACYNMKRKDFVDIAKRWHKINVESYTLWHQPDKEERVTIDYNEIERPSEAPLMDTLLFVKWLGEIRENRHLAKIGEKRKVFKTEKDALQFLDKLFLESVLAIMNNNNTFGLMDPYRMYFDSLD